jgi:two-component system catabolic regulation response regulator CreB
MSAPAHLLVVEDDPAVSRSVARALRGAGYEVTAATSLAEARLDGRSFDVAVLDIEIGDGSGLELARALFASEQVGSVVFHSATLEPAVQKRARELGVLVQKSGDMTRLLEAIARAIAAG